MWLLLTISAYFIFAAVVTVDRFLLTTSIPNPFVYAFYVGLFASILLLFAPFFLEFSPIESVILAVLSGTINLLAVLFLYQAFRAGEVSRVAPAAGALTAILTLILARIIINEVLAAKDLIAFLFLLLGGILISLHLGKKIEMKRDETLFALGAGVAFALAWVVRKSAFLHQPAFSVLIWSSLGFLMGAVVIFLIPRFRKEILSHPVKVEKKKKFLFLGNQLAGGIGGITLNYAVATGSVTLVNALQGVENVFILGIAFLLAKKFPQILKEEFGGVTIWQKTIAVGLIAIGLFLLSQSSFS